MLHKRCVWISGEEGGIALGRVLSIGRVRDGLEFDMRLGEMRSVAFARG